MTEAWAHSFCALARFKRMRLLLYAVAGLFLSISAQASSNAPAKPSAAEIEKATQLQVFLDNANFGPGKIDGRGGEFTRKAAALYRQAKGLPAAPSVDPKAPIDTSGLDLSTVGPVFVDYEITAEDEAAVGHLPSGPEAESHVKWLPYGTLAEALAEKFHCDVNFLKELNPQAAKNFKVGTKIRVPAVKPFELSSVKSLQPGSGAETVVANELGGETSNADAASAAISPSGVDPTKMVSLHVSTKENMLEVYAGGKLAAAFPVTIGSEQTASPIGDWKVKTIAKLPTFRWDLKMLEHGERSAHFHLLPPGPNNPVGVLWIALNKKGIGLHGTDDPDSIGRSASHGCVRLANWDIVKLAELVKPGVAVKIE